VNAAVVNAIVNLTYVVASILFIVGLKGLTHPRKAVRGNLIGSVGMLLAVVAVLFGMAARDQVAWIWVILGIVVGAVIGGGAAIKVQMTGMPQMVALFNGFGGIASVLVAGSALVIAQVGVTNNAWTLEIARTQLGYFDYQTLIATGLSALIGGVTFTGSLVAFAKLQELKIIPSGAFKVPGIQFANIALVIACLWLAYVIVVNPAAFWPYLLLSVLACVLGVTLVVQIGGADMPVVIALLNSYSGLAGTATGFVLGNNVLIVAGTLVGASGLILTKIMCVAMNRSLTNVLFGMIEAGTAASADEVYGGKVKSTTADEIAMMLDGARRVVIVPGYGMAVSQSQHAVRDLMNLLESKGTNVEFGIHPVAGRMPGHMNVLLAEASIPYEKLLEMDAVNQTMEQVDVAIVMGANDVVNPDARKLDSPIAGMPIIDVDKARTVIVVKRSLSPGFAGIPNPLFAADNTLMFFNDGKKAFLDLIAAVKENG
jgi:NAD(P) transhydrogenase subunit beta